MSAADELRAELEDANLAAARARPGSVAFHAAAIDTSAGVIALAGRSGSGKSTLCAAAVLAGYAYVADEITAVSPDDLTVVPFHRPIGLRRGGAEALGIAYPGAADGRYALVYPWPVTGPLSEGGKLAGIVLVDRCTEVLPMIAPVAGAAALLELAQHTVIPDGELGRGFTGLDRIVRAVPVARLTFDTPSQALDLMRIVIEKWTR